MGLRPTTGLVRVGIKATGRADADRHYEQPKRGTLCKPADRQMWGRMMIIGRRTRRRSHVPSIPSEAASAADSPETDWTRNCRPYKHDLRQKRELRAGCVATAALLLIPGCRAQADATLWQPLARFFALGGPSDATISQHTL